MKKKVWFITGISSGIGHELSKLLLERESVVTGVSRKKESDTMFDENKNIFIYCADVTKEQQIFKAVKRVIEKFGKIDILVNAAGYSHMGAFEEFTDIEIRQQFETNFFGMTNSIRAVLPHMRAQKSGLIINFSSVAGRISARGMSVYSASKFAVEGLSEGLADEVGGFGIKVLIVEPNNYRTNAAGRYLKVTNSLKAYKPLIDPLKRAIKNSDRKQGDPVEAAEKILKIVEKKPLPLRIEI
jgi:short-subunit dehydrogenase